MAWAFAPVNDNCIDCGIAIDPCAERNYIVWEPPVRGKHKGQYRRECAKCHDKRLERPYNRAKASDSIIMGKPPQPKLPKAQLKADPEPTFTS